MIKVAKHTHIADKIVMVDGLNGSGKSVLFPVIGSFKNVEKVRIEHIYEYLSTLYFLRKIDIDAAISLMRIYADMAIYNQMISREVNLRIHDDSGLLNNPKPLEYVSRLFFQDGEPAMKRMKELSPILHIMTHQIFSNIDLAFQSFGERLKVVVMVRHPLYMIDHWCSYIDRYGTDPRELSICFDYAGKVIPWFANGWEDKYSALHSIDKVIHSIEWLMRKNNEAHDRLNDAQKEQVIFVPFEKFVIEPWPYINELKHFLGTDITPSTTKALRRQKCPRQSLMAGRGHKVYGWKSDEHTNDDLRDFNRRESFVKENADPESVDILNALCQKYEEKYQLHNQSPWCFLT
jgi:hypothetical protein